MKVWLAVLLVMFGAVTAVRADQRAVDVIAAVKPALVGVGTHDPLRQPASDLLGTGFVVADGHHVLTALHVVNSRGTVGGGKLKLFVGTGEDAEIRDVEIVAKDATHDVALLKVAGTALPALPLDDGPMLPEGTDVLLSGFPIGAVYGLYPATHRAMVSAITPLARPSAGVESLTPEMIRALKNKVLVYQLDGTTLPGNSGGPVIDPTSGRVIAIVNSTFVQERKDAGSTPSSGVGFAMPIAPAIALVRDAGLNP